MKDLYEVLGVTRTAGKDEIKKAYRKLARRFHPDVNKQNPDAAKRFREIQEAYSVLSDEAKRRKYDQFGTVDEAEAAAWQAHARRPEARGFDFRHFGGFTDLGDIFGDIFGGFARREPRAEPPLEVGVELDLAQAVHGASVVVPVRREVNCTECGGEGKVRGKVCPRCHGGGRLVHTSRLRVKLPAGVGDGDRVRTSLRDGSRRDVAVLVKVRPHSFFERKGNDIHTVVPVTFTEAYLGAEVEIGTVHGAVRAKIPPGTQSGQRFRLRGKGVRNVRTGANGDHYYTVQVIVPRVVSPAGRDVARRVGELYGAGLDPRAGLPRSLE
jgi:molecular chaperone DnaJ